MSDDVSDFKLIVAKEEHEKFGKIVKAVVNDKWNTVYSVFEDAISIGVDKEFFDEQKEKSDDKRVMILSPAEFELVEILKEIHEGKDPDQIDWDETDFNLEHTNEEATLKTLFHGKEEIVRKTNNGGE